MSQFLSCKECIRSRYSTRQNYDINVFFTLKTFKQKKIIHYLNTKMIRSSNTEKNPDENPYPAMDF